MVRKPSSREQKTERQKVVSAGRLEWRGGEHALDGGQVGGFDAGREQGERRQRGAASHIVDGQALFPRAV